LEALEDDLNVPLAITRLYSITNDIFKTNDEALRASWRGALAMGGKILGLFEHEEEPHRWLQRSGKADGDPVEEQIAARVLARKERRFADADRIRDELAAEGVILEDKPDGTTEWRRG
jgi:cysteinyl-tRNA synthetase